MPGKAYLYVVTNWHVAVRNGASVIRVNTKDGKTDSWAFGPEDWFFDQALDIAIVSISFDPSKHRYAGLGIEGLVTKDSVERDGIGPGDDVFMVGRFVDHDGGEVNTPAVRFGHISVNPTPIEQPNRQYVDAFCVDMHSRSGYSGSPVFVYRTPGYDLNDRLSSDMKDAKILFSGTNLLMLLGIHFAQFPEIWEIGKPEKAREESAVPLITEGMHVKGLSGMTCVIPAWEIARLLEDPKLKGPRDAVEATLTVPLAPEAEENVSAPAVSLASGVSLPQGPSELPSTGDGSGT